MNTLLERELSRLCQESILSRLLKWLKIDQARRRVVDSIADDSIKLLESSPLGMFMYNLRILFVIGGIIFLSCLTLLNVIFQSGISREGVNLALYLLWSSLLLATVIFLILHRELRKNLPELQEKKFIGLSTIFGKYFFIDILLVIITTIFGKYILKIPIESVIFLAIANLFVYSMYIVGHKTDNDVQVNFVKSLFLPFSVAPVLIIWFVLLTMNTDIRFMSQLFYLLLIWGPILASVWVSIISISTISYLRKKELILTEKTMDTLVSLIASIKEPLAIEQSGRGENQVSNGITSLLRNLCLVDNFYTYRAARMWELVKAIKDKTSQNILDDLALLAKYASDPEFKFPKINAENLHTTIYPPVGSLTSLVTIPIRYNNVQTGFLQVHRSQNGLFTPEEARYLQSVSEIIYFGYQLFWAKQEMLAVNDIDSILNCESLEQAYENATILLHKYLSAQGSMLLFREKDSKKLQLIASQGFKKEYLERNNYEVGRGLTGQCVEKGELILVNDVQKNIHLFDDELLTNVEKGLSSKVVSWMAIPIGEKDDVIGLVKVVNKKTGASKWFTDFDQRLARELASRLKVVLDKFIHLQDLREARVNAIERAMAADMEKKKAEQLAKDRQQDLITLSHQLQSPLHASIGRISLILEEPRLFSSLRRKLEFSSDLLFDSQDLIFGVLLATSREAGQKIYMSNEKVSAREVTKAIYERMRKTGNRPELTFDYKEDPDFPLLSIDKRILSSVLYTLIHNATKYADKGSTLNLECGFEWSSLEKKLKHPAIKVKSIGPPIRFSEREEIFERFYRGHSVRNTGRYKEPGIGLGLWVAKNLMRATGGDITLEFSKDNERLSIFVIHFLGGQYDN